MIDIRTNTLNIEARSQRDGIRTALESNVQATQPPVDVMQPTGMNEQICLHQNMILKHCKALIQDLKNQECERIWSYHN